MLIISVELPLLACLFLTSAALRRQGRASLQWLKASSSIVSIAINTEICIFIYVAVGYLTAFFLSNKPVGIITCE